MWEVRHCASRICDWEYIKKKKRICDWEYAFGQFDCESFHQYDKSDINRKFNFRQNKIVVCLYLNDIKLWMNMWNSFYVLFQKIV